MSQSTQVLTPPRWEENRDRARPCRQVARTDGALLAALFRRYKDLLAGSRLPAG